MKNFFIAALLLFVGTAATAQSIIINGKEGNRPLVWSGFSGSVEAGNPFFAKTAWNINYRYDGVQYEGDKAQLQGFNVKLSFDHGKSWVKSGKESDELLKHEQVHFDIARLCLAEIVQTLQSAPLMKSDYQQRVKDVFRTTLQKYTQLDMQYDTETNHGAIRDIQQKWNAFIAAEEKKLNAK